MDFTGERYTDESNGLEIFFEHTHRYISTIPVIKNKIVLDASCGTGYGSEIISHYAKKVYAIDIDEETIEYCKYKYKNNNIEFIVSSIEKLPISSNSIDVIISFETIEHVNEDIQHSFLKETKRVLKSDGVLIMSTPNKTLYTDIPKYKNKYHIKEFYKSEFKNFISKYFSYYEIYNQDFHIASAISSEYKKDLKILNESINDGRYFIFICSDKNNIYLKDISSAYIDMQNYYYENSILIHKLLYKIDKLNNKLYIDIGYGFSEDYTISKALELNNDEFNLEFNIEQYNNINSIRWDPIENRYCDIYIYKIIFYYYDYRKEIDLNNIESNGYIYENKIVFHTKDPFIIIKENYNYLNKIKIIGRIFLKEEEQCIKELMETMNKSEHDKEKILYILKNKEAYIDELEKQAKGQRDYIEELKKQIESS